MLSLPEFLPIGALTVSLGSALYSYRLSRRAHHVSTYYGAIGLFLVYFVISRLSHFMRRLEPRLAGLPGFLGLWLVGGMPGEIGR
jgi:hypothetical protein